MAIILRLDRMMADRKISLNELSEKVGIANVNLSKIKTGKVSAIRFFYTEFHLQSTGLSARGYIRISERYGRIEFLFFYDILLLCPVCSEIDGVEKEEKIDIIKNQRSCVRRKRPIGGGG